MQTKTLNILATGMGWIDHTPGGLNRYFADYLKAMHAQGHKVRGLMTAHGEATNAPDYVRDVVNRPVKLSTFTRTRAFRTAIKRELVMDPPDVFNPHFALYSSLVTRDMIPRAVPIVTHFHGPWARESLVEDQGSDWQQQMRYRIKRNVELLSYRRSDRFIVLSRYFRDILVEDYGVEAERIHIIPGAVDTDRFRPAEGRAGLRLSLGIGEGDVLFFCARRLVKRMGIDNLIRAMTWVAEAVPEARLVIAGDGALRQQLESLVGELGLSDKIRLLGRVSNEDLVRWYQAADFSVVPTITLEGFGLVTTEALACGTPVLGTPYGGTKEILEKLDRGLLFESHEPESMARKMIAVATGACSVPDRSTCRAHVLDHYTWERVATSVAEVFQQAIAERREEATS